MPACADRRKLAFLLPDEQKGCQADRRCGSYGDRKHEHPGCTGTDGRCLSDCLPEMAAAPVFHSHTECKSADAGDPGAGYLCPAWDPEKDNRQGQQIPAFVCPAERSKLLQPEPDQPPDDLCSGNTISGALWHGVLD